MHILYTVSKVRVPISKHTSITSEQAIIPIAPLSLPILPFYIDDRRKGGYKRQTEHANIDAVTRHKPGSVRSR